MASKYTITGNIADHLPGDARRVKAVARLNVADHEAVIDTTTNKIITPVVPVTINTDGSFAAEGLIDTSASDLNVTPNTLRWALEFTWVDLSGTLNGRVERRTKLFGWFDVTANATLASKAGQLDTPRTAPVWRDAFRGEMEAILAEALEHTAPLTAPANGQVATYLSTPGDAQDAAREQAAVAAARMRDPLAVWRGRLAMRHLVPAVMVVVGGSTWFGSTTSNPSMKVTERFLYRMQSAYPSGIAGYEKPQVNVGNDYPTRDTKPGVQLYVSAVGGQTSANYVNATNRPFIQWHRPGLVIHGVGANDALDNPTYHVSIPDYITNVAAAVDSIDAGLTTYGPATHVLVHQFRRPGVSKATWAAYGAALHEVARTRPNVIVVDLSEPFELLDVAGADPLDLLDVDGSHLNDAGHAMLTDLLCEALGVPQPTNDWKAVLVDTFTRPNGAPGNVELPASRAWAAPGSAVGAIASNKLTLTTAGTLLVESGLADLEFEGIITMPGSGTVLPGLVFRADGDTNRMGLYLNRASATIQLYKTVSTATTSIASTSMALPAGDYHVKVRVVGDRIWGYVNGVKVIDYTMTSAEVTALASLTKVGIRDNATPPSGVAWSSLRVRRP